MPVGKDAWLVASYTGEIDFTNRDEFRRKLEHLAENEYAIADLSGVSYIDSSGLSELVRLNRLREANGFGPIRLVIGNAIARMYAVSGLRDVFPSFDSLTAAKESGT